MMGDRRALICEIHGFVPLSYKEVRAQLREIDCSWKCPHCGRLSEMIEFFQFSFDNGCTECKMKFDSESYNLIVWSDRILGFFCNKLCHGIYMARLDEKYRTLRRRKNDELDTSGDADATNL